jgi:hypothetical protein
MSSFAHGGKSLRLAQRPCCIHCPLSVGRPWGEKQHRASAATTSTRVDLEERETGGIVATAFYPCSLQSKRRLTVRLEQPSTRRPFERKEEHSLGDTVAEESDTVVRLTKSSRPPPSSLQQHMEHAAIRVLLHSRVSLCLAANNLRVFCGRWAASSVASNEQRRSGTERQVARPPFRLPCVLVWPARLLPSLAAAAVSPVGKRENSSLGGPAGWPKEKQARRGKGRGRATWVGTCSHLLTEHVSFPDALIAHPAVHPSAPLFAAASVPLQLHRSGVAWLEFIGPP